jgi:transcriptional regulator with XRE-family HTH domain
MSMFSKNLRFLRKKANYNQEDIALLFQKQANTVGNWENRKSEPCLQELIKLGEFFKVGMEELLHEDLEARFQAPQPSSTEDHSVQPVRLHDFPERSGSLINEGGPDAFWLILRELRVIHEKIDTLIAERTSSAEKRNADKSYH